MNKIKLIKDKKLAETNLKILNNILPCNKNLHKWGKSSTKLCYICGEEESISHLLYHCRHVKPVWEIVNSAISECDISHDLVVFGFDLDTVLNHVFSIIVYFIYREWLICSFENKHRTESVCLKSLVNFLNTRKHLYSKCSHSIWRDICIKLDIIIDHFELYM